MIIAHMSGEQSAAIFRFLVLAALVSFVIFIGVNIVIMCVASRFISERQISDDAPVAPRPAIQFSVKSLLIAMTVFALYAVLSRYASDRLGQVIVPAVAWWCGSLAGATWALWRARAVGCGKLAQPLLIGGTAGGAIVVAFHMLVTRLNPFVLLQYSFFGGIGGLLLGLLYYGVAKYTVTRW